MCHPHVAGDEASRQVITEVLTYQDELEIMMTRDEEIPTPKFALQRVHDILFIVGGKGKYSRRIDYFDCYSAPADRWSKVSCTLLHSYSALLSNYKPCHGSGRYSTASRRGGPGSGPGQSMWDLWWTKWQWDRFFSEFLGFPVNI
jgi:hypothetical protein